MKKRLNIKYPIDEKHVGLAHRLFDLNGKIIDVSKVTKGTNRIFSVDTDGLNRSVKISDIPNDWLEDLLEPNESEFYKWVHENKDFHNHSDVYEVAKSSRNKTLFDMISSIDEIIIGIGQSLAPTHLNECSLLSFLKEQIEQLKEK